MKLKRSGDQASAQLLGGCRWYKGDLHCHTHHSDGKQAVAEMAAAAHAQGLDFLAITDHNTISHWDEIAAQISPPVILIPGQEVTTYKGHANVWGAKSWMDFRLDSAEMMAQVAQAAHGQGALFSINHPKEGGPPWLYGEDIPADCVEVWQAPWFVSNYQSLAWWDSLLRKGRRLVAVGGSDLHTLPRPDRPAPYPLGTPTTWVYAAAPTATAILDGIRAGHVFISASPAGPELYLTAGAAMQGDAVALTPTSALFSASPFRLSQRERESTITPLSPGARVRALAARGKLLRLVSNRGVEATLPITSDAFACSPTLPAAGLQYVRAEIIRPPELPLRQEPAALIVEALSNPIYLEDE